MEPAGHTFTIEEPFDKALKLVRGALTAGDLEIVSEMDMTPRCRLLLVDCPLLVFEGLVLDRAAAVYFPLHVLLTFDGARTHVSTVKPAALLDARPPAGAAEPFESLEARVAAALGSLVEVRKGARNRNGH